MGPGTRTFCVVYGWWWEEVEVGDEMMLLRCIKEKKQALCVVWRRGGCPICERNFHLKEAVLVRV